MRLIMALVLMMSLQTKFVLIQNSCGRMAPNLDG